MPPNRFRLRRAIRNVPPQMLLMAAVVVAALASALLSASSNIRSGRARSVLTDPMAAAPLPEEETALSRPVEEAFEAARKGDLEGYLAQFTDPLRTQLARTRAEKGDAYLRDYLARLNGSVKGLAFDLTRKEETGPESVRLPVEFVYRDRNEVQSFFLRRSGQASWRISRIDAVRSAPTLIPYGTPVEQVK